MADSRTALVTGGMGGLGEAIAIALADAGHRVLVTHSPGNDHVVAWLGSQAAAGYSFKAYPVDVADTASCKQLADAIHADGFTIDILVNNAGITRDSTLRKMNIENWRAVISTNLDSLFNMTKPLLEDMLSRGWGRIINIASINASKGQIGQTNYAAAKAGIHGFTKSLALEVTRKGITVNTISPGYLDTKMVAAVPRDILEKQIISQIPAGRLGKPSEIAALVNFVASDAAAFMTGANVAMNGGQHME